MSGTPTARPCAGPEEQLSPRAPPPFSGHRSRPAGTGSVDTGRPRGAGAGNPAGRARTETRRLPLRLAAAAIALACVSATGALEIRDAAAQDNAAPTFSDGSETRRYVGEETASGGAFGAPVSATDPDGDSIQYTLGGTDAALFAIDSATGQLRTAATTTLEYETRNSYDVEVSASDGRGGTDAVSVDIRVLDSIMVLVPTPTVRKRLRVTASVARIDEGGTVTFTVQSSRAAPAGGLRVAYSLKQLALAEGADAYDFRPLPNLNTHHRGTVTIAESATSASVTYRTVADDFDETDVVLIFDIGPSAHNNFSGQACNLTNSLDVSTIAARPAGCWARVDVRDLGSSSPPESVPFTRYASVFAGHTSAFGGSNVQRLTPGDPLEFTVSLNVPAPRGGLVVHYGVNEKGSDVSPDIVQYPNIDRRSVTIPEGETERFVTIELGDRDPLVQGCADGGQTAAGCIRVTILSPSFVAVEDGYYLPYEHYPSSSRYYIDSILPRAATIAPRTSPIVEGGAARFTITLFETAPAGGLNVSVRLSQEGDFATTTLPETRTVSVAGGAATGSTWVPTVNDRNDEPDGKIVAQLQATSAYTVGDPGTAEVVVRDNDTLSASISADASTIDEGGTASFTVTLSQPAPTGGLNVSVRLSQEGAFATAALPETRAVTVAAGETTASVGVATEDDALDEPDGKIVARVQTSGAYGVGTPNSAEVAVRDDDAISATIAAGTSPIDEGATASFTVTLSQAAPAGGLNVSVRLTQEGAFATAALPETRAVTVAAGETTAAVGVATEDDALDEPDGKIVARVQTSGAYGVGTPNSAEVVVRDDDTLSASISADASPIDEGGTASFTVTLSQAGPAGGLNVSVRLTQEGAFATVTLPETRIVTVAAGQTTAAVSVATEDDALDEPDGRIVARVQTASTYAVGTPNSAEVAVRDDDTIAATIAAGTTAIGEGGTATFTVTLSQAAPTGGLGVSVRLSQEGDFATTTLPETRTLTVAAGQTTATTSVATEDDALDEPDGKIVAEVRTASGYAAGTPGSAEVVVRDDDSVKATIAAGTSPIDEGGTASFTVTLSQAAPAGGLNVSVRLTQEGAFATVTLPETRIVTVAAGETTAAVGVATEDDALDEPDGKIVAEMRTANGYMVGTPGSAEVAVRDDDTIAATISAGTSPIDEGGTATFTITLSQAAPTGGLGVSVRLSQEGDFATTTLPETRTLTVAAGQTTATTSVATEDDALDEPDGKIVAEVRTASGYAAGTPGSAEVVVRDDDSVKATIAAGTTAIGEGGTASFTVTLSQPAPTGGLAVSVRLSQEGAFATATLPATRTLTVAAGQTTAATSVATEDDALDEPDGRIVAEVRTASGYAVGTPGSAEVVVRDDDAIAATIAAGTSPIDEGATASFTVTLSQAAPAGGLNVSVRLRQEGAFATAALPATRIVTVAASATTAAVGVATEDDAREEPDGKIVAEVRTASGYAAGTPGSAEIVVRDDDAISATIAAGTSPIDEGETASFTVTLSQAAPAGGLNVSVRLSQEGAFATAALPETRIVTVAAGTTTATTSVATEDDSRDEADGRIVAEVRTASGYAAGTPGSAEVVVRDDDAISATIAAGTSPIDEGETASFTVTLSQAAPAGGLNVSVRLSQEGAFAATALPETRIVTVAASATTAAVGVATEDDAREEPDGKIVAEVRTASGYAAGTPGSAEIVVRDDDAISATIAAGTSPIDEGETASFTVTLSRAAPTGGLNVSVHLSQEGAFAATALPETRIVTIAAGATTATASVATEDDALEEPDGKIVAELRTASGYAAGTPGSAEVVVRDNDAVSATIAAGTSPIDEGGTASFTVTLSRAAPTGGLNVSVRLSQEGAFAATDLPETRVVTVASGATAATVGVATEDDALDEPDGKIVARVRASGAYAVGDPGAAEVVVRDNDATLVMLSADTSPITEGQTAGFIVRLSQAAPSGGLAVRVGLSQKGDFAASSLPEMRLVQLAGGTMAATLKVPTVDDAVDEAHGKIMARAERMQAYAVGNAGAAEVSVLDDDDRRRNSTARIVEQTVPRVGRAIAGTVTRAVDCERHDRFLHDRAAIGGVDVRPVPAAREAARAMGGRPVDPWSRDGRRRGFGMSAGQVLRNSSFALGSADRQGGDGVAYWGETAIAGFSGRADTVSMDGSVVSGMWGAERIADNRRSGLAFAVSRGKVAYGLPRFGSGEFRSSLASVHPYMCWYPSGDTSLWGMVGAGLGKASLTGAARVDSLGLVMRMVAGGLTRKLREDSKHALLLRVSAVGVSLRSRKSGALPRIKSTVVSVRKTVESSWKRRFESGALLRLSLEVGGRFDMGDAENGVGLLTGAGLRFAAGENRGFAVEATGHRLVKHTDSSFRDWGGKLRLGYSRRRLGGQLSLGLDLVGGLPRAAARRDLEADAFAPAGLGVASHAAGWAGLSARYARPVLRSTGTLSLHGGVSWRRRGSRAYSAGLGLNLKEGLEIGLGGRFEDAPDGERAANFRLRLTR